VYLDEVFVKLDLRGLKDLVGLVDLSQDHWVKPSWSPNLQIWTRLDGVAKSEDLDSNAVTILNLMALPLYPTVR